jgi:trehalose 6-phosphate synthase
MERRASSFAEDLFERAEPSLKPALSANLNPLLERFTKRHRLAGTILYRKPDGVLAAFPGFADALSELQAPLEDAAQAGESIGGLSSLRGKPIYLYIRSFASGDSVQTVIAVVQSASTMHQRLGEMWRIGFTRFLIQALAIALVTMLIIRWNVVLPPPSLSQEIFGPLAKEVNQLAHSLSVARAAAEEEAKLRQKSEALWTPERLKEHVRVKLDNRALVVVSNREPYMHFRKGKKMEWLMPASGLVTGLEPILRACGGTWVAHGSGDADHEVVDTRDRLVVPPDQPQYALRRVWLSVTSPTPDPFSVKRIGAAIKRLMKNLRRPFWKKSATRENR